MLRHLARKFITNKCINKAIISRSISYDIDLSVENVSINKYITKLQEEYEGLKQDSNLKNGTRISQIQPVIDLLGKRKHTVDNLLNLQDLLKEDDPDLRKLAEDERVGFEEALKGIDVSIKQAVLPVEKEDFINAIVLEVNAGVGGQEAMLFASELFDMYVNFILLQGWDYELAEYLSTDLGGIRHASLLINGRNVFRYFKYEAGVHRVQRIPSTEKSGRIHTSTVSVIALPQPDDIEVKMESKDLRIETKRATGAGGQHVNTTDSAVRIVHLPTGLAVECQTDRSQIKNRQIAMQRLRAKLYDQQLDAQTAKTEATKKSQVRSNFRNEKIRTYNFNQDRITDHRLNSNIYNLKTFMVGGEQLEVLIDKLDYSRKVDLLKEIVDSVKQ